MGIWKEIKYALNSTLGTNYFTPLDKILGRELEASENTYKDTGITHSGTVIFESGKKIDTYTYPDILMKCGGSINIKLVGSFPGAPQNSKGYLDYTITTVVKHSNGESYEYTEEFAPTTDKTYLSTTSAISIKAGDIVTVTIKAQISGSPSYAQWGEGHTENYTSKLKIGADVTQSSLIEVL